jgi:hypothetical protein
VALVDLFARRIPQDNGTEFRLKLFIEAHLWLTAFARAAGAPAPPRVSEEEALRASGPDAVYYDSSGFRSKIGLMSVGIDQRMNLVGPS